MVTSVKYSAASPYFTTEISDNFLDIMNTRRIPKLSSDQIITINETYQYRPDMLAHDLYDNPGLWWVFAIRNPNTLIDTIYDFKTGIKIYLPKISTLKAALGI